MRVPGVAGLLRRRIRDAARIDRRGTARRSPRTSSPDDGDLDPAALGETGGRSRLNRPSAALRFGAMADLSVSEVFTPDDRVALFCVSMAMAANDVEYAFRQALLANPEGA